MNFIRYRRNLAIVAGMIVINIATHAFMLTKGFDVIVGCSYFSLNSIWISIMYMATQESVNAVDKIIEDEMF